MTNPLVFSALPLKAQEEVKDVLSAYNTCHVHFDTVTSSVYVCAHTSISSSDQGRIYLGELTSKDLFTLEERMLNYVRSFRDFPVCCDYAYKGKKDWQALKSDWTKVELVNGDLVFS